MRIESNWEEHADVNRTLVRLSHDIRSDIHRSRDVTLTDDPVVLKLTTPDGTVITYEDAADEIVRDYQPAEGVRSREFYHKPSGYETRITVGESPRWIELLVTHDPQLVGVEPKTVAHVEAEVGRFLRLAQSQGGTP
jgi:hypothetical protein